MTSVTGLLIFPRVQSTSENSEKSCLSSEIKSIFNFNNTEFSVYYVFLYVNMFLSNLRHCMKYITWHHNHIIFTLKKHLILSQCEKTAWENSTSIQWMKPAIFMAENLIINIVSFCLISFHYIVNITSLIYIWINNQ